MRQDEPVWNGGKQMSRLINEDDVMEMLTQVGLSYTSIPMIEAKTRLRDIPSAYDVNKVKERLNELKEIYPVGNGNYEYAVRSDKAIEIVEAGGINENR